MLDFGFYNMDCMDGMREFPDKYFDLAIVDPPYGGGGNEQWDNKKRGRFGGRFDKYHISDNAETDGGFFDNPEISAERTGAAGANKYGTSVRHWDIAPPPEYFDELFRVSKNQIIWGGNYFKLPPTRCFNIWRKLTISDNFSMAMCEYAWTSFNGNAKWYECAPQDPTRFHPTQKPVSLYEWQLSLYAQLGDKILDTHVGSASSLVACHHQGFKYVGFEIDEEYYRLASERLEAEKAQVSLFDEVAR